MDWASGSLRAHRATPEATGEQATSEGEEERGGDPRGELELVERREARAGADAGVDARRAVGVHDDDRPGAVLDLPVERLAAVRGGEPEALVGGGRGCGRPRGVLVGRLERVDVDVGQR